MVEIPDVSELVNIIMALHNDAEKENNMFDTKSPYYQRLRTILPPTRTIPILDIIQKYINGLKRIDEQNMSMCFRES